MTAAELQRMATQVRRDIIRMTNGAKSGHPGGSLGCADLMTTLYFQELEQKPENFSIDGKNEDMFFLSIGHISPVLYSVLARSGYFPVKELATFRKIDSRLQGHPSVSKNLPGIRVASGSLGQGLSVALGAAEAKKMDNDPKLVYVLMGDGEMGEGQNWEAITYAAAKNVDNLIAIVDRNGLQIDGTTENVLAQKDLKAKFEAFGWIGLEMNGHDIQNIIDVIGKAKVFACKGQPIVIIMKTEMGHGIDFMLNDSKWHGTPPNDEQTLKALQQLEETFGDY